MCSFGCTWVIIYGPSSVPYWPRFSFDNWTLPHCRRKKKYIIVYVRRFLWKNRGRHPIAVLLQALFWVPCGCWPFRCIKTALCLTVRVQLQGVANRLSGWAPPNCAMLMSFCNSYLSYFWRRSLILSAGLGTSCESYSSLACNTDGSSYYLLFSNKSMIFPITTKLAGCSEGWPQPILVRQHKTLLNRDLPFMRNCSTFGYSFDEGWVASTPRFWFGC